MALGAAKELRSVSIHSRNRLLFLSWGLSKYFIAHAKTDGKIESGRVLEGMLRQNHTWFLTLDNFYRISLSITDLPVFLVFVVD